MVRDRVGWEKRRARTVVVGGVSDSVGADTWEAARIVSRTGPVTTDGDINDDWKAGRATDSATLDGKGEG